MKALYTELLCNLMIGQFFQFCKLELSQSRLFLFSVITKFNTTIYLTHCFFAKFFKIF